jgi:hypothetical protein
MAKKDIKERMEQNQESGEVARKANLAFTCLIRPVYQRALLDRDVRRSAFAHLPIAVR